MNKAAANHPSTGWHPVHVREYPQAIDLSGRDFISLFNRPKEEVATLVGALAAKTEMRTEEMPEECVMALTGEAADEIHEWPNATLGPEFRHLVLQFREGRLIHMIWKCAAGH
jgi:hypothetical protein